MTHVTTTDMDDGTLFPESYPTFWDAIPVDAADDPSKRPTTPPEDAYTTFTNLAEDRGPVTLTVEQSDVGLN